MCVTRSPISSCGIRRSCGRRLDLAEHFRPFSKEGLGCAGVGLRSYRSFVVVSRQLQDVGVDRDSEVSSRESMSLGLELLSRLSSWIVVAVGVVIVVGVVSVVARVGLLTSRR